MTCATLFSGFGGADLGLHAAGYRPVWGIEYDDAIASVARANGLPVRTDDVLAVDFAAMERPDWLHMSPVCKSFSPANAAPGEREHDRATAAACARAVDVLRPDTVSIENVRAYGGSESLGMLLAGLRRGGYRIASRVLDAADYGVAQTRDRLVVVASRLGAPRLPLPTHAPEAGAPTLFVPARRRHVSWREATEDLWADLPEGRLSPWQAARLTPGSGALLVGAGGYDGTMVARGEDRPAMTITANSNQGMVRVVLRGAGRVLQPSARFIARLCAFPDTYALPEGRALAIKGLGNAVPPLLMQRVAEANRPRGPVQHARARTTPRAEAPA